MQSRRACLPVIDDVADFEAIAGRADLLVADPAGVYAAELDRPHGPVWTVLVGPEGGLTPQELERVAGAPLLALGPHILRAGTAPVAAVAVLMGLPA
jgi:16S rRNA (uracil1498-N3)-methyltransferase